MGQEWREAGSESVTQAEVAPVGPPGVEGEEPASPSGAMGEREVESPMASHSAGSLARERALAEPGWVRTRPASTYGACGESRDPS
jgi:hypothetical protein